MWASDRLDHAHDGIIEETKDQTIDKMLVVLNDAASMPQR